MFYEQTVDETHDEDDEDDVAEDLEAEDVVCGLERWRCHCGVFL